MHTHQNASTGAKRFTIGQRWFNRGTAPTATFGNYIVAFPHLRLSGKWLQECGFCIGQRVNVSYVPGKLVITLTPSDRRHALCKLMKIKKRKFILPEQTAGKSLKRRTGIEKAAGI